MPEPVGSRQNLKSNRKPHLNVCSVKWTMGRKGVNWGPKRDPVACVICCLWEITPASPVEDRCRRGMKITMW